MSWYDNAATEPSVGPLMLVGRSIATATGYSLLELERAGISEEQAHELGCPVDRERTTMLGCNVMQLRALLGQAQRT
jgi:ribosomal protein L13E